MRSNYDHLEIFLFWKYKRGYAKIWQYLRIGVKNFFVKLIYSGIYFTKISWNFRNFFGEIQENKSFSRKNSLQFVNSAKFWQTPFLPIYSLNSMVMYKCNKHSSINQNRSRLSRERQKTLDILTAINFLLLFFHDLIAADIVLLVGLLIKIASILLYIL